MRPRSAAFVVLFATFFALAGSAAPPATGTLGDADRRAIESILERYRTSWLRGDAATIRSLFTDDTVFLPHHGLEPVEGLAALSDFWWPSGGPKVEIVRFELSTRRIEGAGDLAYAWGRQSLEWTQDDAKGLTRTRTRGNHLTILRRGAEGWKIVLQAGDDEPNEHL